MRVMDDKKTDALCRVVMTLALAALTAAVYLGTLGNGFVYDDHSQIVRNPWIKDIRYLPRIFSTHTFGFLDNGFAYLSYRPMVYVVYMAEYAVFGLKPWGWHLVNSLLHAVNSVMVFLTLSRLLEDYRVGDTRTKSQPVFHIPAFFGSVLFVVHPVNSEPVSWVGCVPELFYAFLCLTVLYGHIKTFGERPVPPPRIIAYPVLTGILFFLAVLFKETAIVLPVLLVVYDCMRAKEERFLSARRVRRYIPYATAAGAYLVVRWLALGRIAPPQKYHSYLSALEHLMNAPVFIVHEALTLLYPIAGPFRLYKPVLAVAEPDFLFSLAFLSLAAALFLLNRKKVHPLYVMALSLVALPLLPTLYAPAISRFPFADRYLYFPSIGFALFLALAVRRLIDYGMNVERRAYVWAFTGAFAALAVFSSWSAAKRSLVWKDDFTLWSASADKDRENYFAFYNLGIAYFQTARMPEGVRMMKASVETNGLMSHPDKAMLTNAHMSLARAYLETGLVKEAEKEYREVLRFSPANRSALALLMMSLCAGTEGPGGPMQLSATASLPVVEPVLVSHLQDKDFVAGKPPDRCM